MSAVYSVELKASFYVLADSQKDAERIAGEICSLSELEADMPAGSNPCYSGYRIRAQGEDYRRRCANYAVDGEVNG